jgi:hypothetical protein
LLFHCNNICQNASQCFITYKYIACLFALELTHFFFQEGGFIPWPLKFNRIKECVACTDSLEFGRFRKISRLRHVCSSVCPHGTTRFPWEGFSWNLIFHYFSKCCRDSASVIIIRQEQRVLYMKTNIHLALYMKTNIHLALYMKTNIHLALYMKTNIHLALYMKTSIHFLTYLAEFFF